MICEVCPTSRFVAWPSLTVPPPPLLQIFCYPQPLYLLRISRTNKAFHDFLTRRNSAYVWQAARKNVVGLPEPFPGMSEPAYARLCFDSLCQVHEYSRPPINFLCDIHLSPCSRYAEGLGLGVLPEPEALQGMQNDRVRLSILSQLWHI